MTRAAIPVRRTSLPCALHLFHDPVPVGTNQLHHLWPVGMGGPENGKKVPVCPTGHMNAHRYIELLVKYKGKAPWPDARRFGKATRDLGQRGYDLWVAAGRPPITGTN